MNRPVLTTTDVARLAAVTPSTIKRWADRGLLPFSRTAGGHRRFDGFAVERFLRAPTRANDASDPVAAAWIRCLVDGHGRAIDGRLLEARSRWGRWSRVADELATALVEMGRQWAWGHLTIAQEHVASDALARALARVGEALPSRVDAPRCLLACAGEDEHTLGLSLAEVCVRERGWTPVWLGRRTPVAEIARVVVDRTIAMVALSASVVMADCDALRTIVDEVGAACKARNTVLVLGGAGSWPAEPEVGVRLTSFAAFGDILETELERR